MARIQVRLTDEQARQLLVLATEQGVPVAKVIRDALNRYLPSLDQAAIRTRAIASIGGFHSGRSDVAESHDDAFAGALQGEATTGGRVGSSS